ncbi:MAG TPA: sigma-70 family RNA polymerase sigma factor [Candidatus Udaeobacter sp.]|nr:sigma-70 family RNA polymerase sigma factor [Candidatus Udaeobacter sp.]
MSKWCEINHEAHEGHEEFAVLAGQIRRLVLAGSFWLDIGVPAADNGASGSANDQTNRQRGAAFVTTQWSVVLAARGESAEADAALEKLCRTYWWPLYGFVRREGFRPEEAQDLTQAFFARLLERKDLETVRQERGRLRSYLLASIKNFLSKARDRQLTVKRGEGRPLVSLEDLLARERADQEPAHKLSADRIYERRWALTLLDQVMTRLRAEYEAAGKLPLFDRLKELLARESGQPSQAEIAAEMEMTENAVKQAFHRLRHRYRQLLLEEISHTVATPDDVEDELRHFIAVLQT